MAASRSVPRGALPQHSAYPHGPSSDAAHDQTARSWHGDTSETNATNPEEGRSPSPHRQFSRASFSDSGYFDVDIDDGGEAEETEECFYPPVVLIHGFLGTGVWYWGWALGKDGSMMSPNTPHRVYVSEVGPLSSLHDRACELFYQLKGGTVDYGDAHSKACGHDRCGRTYAGSFQEWSADRPVHLVGHSLGGCTARVLQQLLVENAFEGYDTNSSWVRSVTTIFSPNMGAITPYLLGAHPTKDGVVSKFSFGWWGMKFTHVYEFLDSAFLRSRLVDFNLGHWHLPTWRDASSPLEALRLLAQSLKSPSPLITTADSAPHDMTIAGMAAWNKRTCIGHAGTMYLSFVGSHTFREERTGYHLPRLTSNPALFSMSAIIGTASLSMATNHLDSVLKQRREGIMRRASIVYGANELMALVGSEPSSCGAAQSSADGAAGSPPKRIRRTSFLRSASVVLAALEEEQQSHPHAETSGLVRGTSVSEENESAQSQSTSSGDSTAEGPSHATLLWRQKAILARNASVILKLMGAPKDTVLDRAASALAEEGNAPGGCSAPSSNSTHESAQKADAQEGKSSAASPWSMFGLAASMGSCAYSAAARVRDTVGRLARTSPAPKEREPAPTEESKVAEKGVVGDVPGDVHGPSYHAEDWWENDGVLSSHGQMHPHPDCSPRHCGHISLSTDELAHGFGRALFERHGHSVGAAHRAHVHVRAHNRGHGHNHTHLPNTKHAAHGEAAASKQPHAHTGQLGRGPSRDRPSAVMGRTGPFWRVIELRGLGHCDLVPFPREREVHKNFFEGLFLTLREFDEECHATRTGKL